MKNTVEMIEIWVPVEKGGEAYSFHQQKNMKLVARIVNGKVLFLEKNVMLEKILLSKESMKKIIESNY